MLREFGKTRQEASHLRRRWFASPQCDLILWLNEDESLWGFQLCYDKPASEHALTWIHDSGFSHMAVDSGGADRAGKGAPFLVADGVIDPRYILSIFEKESALVPSQYHAFIAAKIRELAGAREV